MNNSQNLHFEEKSFQQEYESVIRYFDIANRSTPQPYLPAQNKLVSETELLQHIKCEDNRRGLSIYIHIPFCDRKCTFCDLYSFHVPARIRDIMENYVRALEREIHFWGKSFDWCYPPVTTVHFGGGSPLILSAEQLNRLINALKQYYNINEYTEIAVELTTSQINQENILFLKKNNIGRIHVGIQTLSDTIRNIIGRKESARVVREKLKLILAEGFITSVDLLYGLPLQTLQSFEMDLKAIIQQGVDGFALYELQISRSMNKLIKKNPTYQPDKANSYQMVLIGKKILNDAGYRNVFFNHYGNDRDKNLYFTFPQREEDCIAFGTIADAQLGNVFFRHKKHKGYLNAIANGEAGIDYGYVEDRLRATIRKFEMYLMSTRIPAVSINHLVELLGYSFKGIFDLWKVAGLIRPIDTKGNFELTGSGCWFLSTMIEQIRRLSS